MKNKKKILLVSGIGIVIMAIAIGVAIAVSRPGTMKNSRQAASGQATSTTQSDSGTHGKKASREQAESKGKKNDLKSPDQKNTTGADSKAKAAKKLSHSENQEPSDSKANTTKQEDQPENPDRDQSNDGNGKDSATGSDQTTNNNKKPGNQKNGGSDKSDSGKKSSDTIELPFVPAE